MNPLCKHIVFHEVIPEIIKAPVHFSQLSYLIRDRKEVPSPIKQSIWEKREFWRPFFSQTWLSPP